MEMVNGFCTREPDPYSIQRSGFVFDSLPQAGLVAVVPGNGESLLKITRCFFDRTLPASEMAGATPDPSCPVQCITDNRYSMLYTGTIFFKMIPLKPFVNPLQIPYESISSTPQVPLKPRACPSENHSQTSAVSQLITPTCGHHTLGRSISKISPIFE